MDLTALEPVRAVWARTERARASALFLGGVGWDWATLRIERMPDNVLLLVYFFVLLVVSVFELRQTRGASVPGLLRRWPRLAPMASQFLLGALLSAFAVHVFGATHPGPMAWFLVMLVVLAVANEAGFPALRGRVARVALLAFLCFQTFSLVVPFFAGTLLGPILPMMVTISAVGALLALVLVRVQPDDPPLGLPGEAPWKGVAREIALPVGAATAGLLGLFALIVLGVVPPLPLVMRDAVVARDVVRTGGDYQIVEPHRRNPVGRLFFGPPRISWSPGQKVSVFTAVFAPSGMELDVVHVWEWWDPEGGAWQASDQIRQHVKGGRVDGFRTWSTKRNLKPGDWRVRVTTSTGREVGRVRLVVDAG